MKPLILAALLGLSSCATGPSEIDQAYGRWDAEADYRQRLIAWCQANNDPCEDEYRDSDLWLAKAERRIQQAERSSGGGAALMAVGAGLLSQPRPVICNTSNTTIPTTVCQ
jgi:hypothetical protein